MLKNKASLFIVLCLSLAVIFNSCTTEFERARSSNNPSEILSKAHEYYKKENYLNAQTLYELAIQYYRGKKEAEQLFFNYAYTFYHLGEYISAAHYFNSFATTFYNSSFKEEAAFMSAYSHYKLSPNYKLDQTYSSKAIDAFQEFANNFQESERLNECNELIDEMRKKLEKKAFAQGELYFNTGQYQAAVVSFQNMLNSFPGSSNDEEAKYLMVKSSYILAENSIVSKRQERYEEAKKLALKTQNKIKNKSFKREIAGIIKSINKKLKDKV